MPYFITSSGKIEININLQDASNCSHSGDCEQDVKELLKKPYIKSQLKKIKPEVLASELEEYGAWDEKELSDHDFNLVRILWLACGDISDNALESLENLKLFDNEGENIDRYTAVFTNRPEREINMFEASGFNENPFHPLGIGMHTSAMIDDGKNSHLGKEIKIEDLPEKAREFVEQNL